MKKPSSGVSIGNVLKKAGAYIAWVIGSGFATGQEALQFFSSYGYWSYAVVGIDLLGFMLLGYFLMCAGYENRENASFDQFRYFCGKKLGTGYSWLILVTILMMIPVLLSGGGATLHEYSGLPKPLASGLLALAVLAVYLIGFEKMVGIISKIGPVMILFSLTVGVVSLFRNGEHWGDIPAFEKLLSPFRAAPAWWISGFLYLGLNFFPGSTYFTQLGISANSKKELKWGAVCGSVVLLLSVTVMNTAILLSGDAVAGLDIPVLYLAQGISKVFGAVFSVMLVLGIFSSCSVMMWTVCRELTAKTHHNALTAAAVIAVGYVISLFSFGDLIGTVYPIIGYIGLLYLGLVLWNGFFGKRTGKSGTEDKNGGEDKNDTEDKNA